LGAYRIPPETGILIPSGFANYRFRLSRDARKAAHTSGGIALLTIRLSWRQIYSVSTLSQEHATTMPGSVSDRAPGE